MQWIRKGWQPQAWTPCSGVQAWGWSQAHVQSAIERHALRVQQYYPFQKHELDDLL